MAAQPSDDVNFASILKSMGIQNYDSRVITALNEYARRYAGDLLSDAMDYAHHADRQVISPALCQRLSLCLSGFNAKVAYSCVFIRWTSTFFSRRRSS